jgi:hypothetical protein
MFKKYILFFLTIIIPVLFNYTRCNCSSPASTCYNDCTRRFILNITNQSEKSCSFLIIDDDYEDESSIVEQKISNDTFNLAAGGKITDTITYRWTGVDGCFIYKGHSDSPSSGSGHATKIVVYSSKALRFNMYVYPYDTLKNMEEHCNATLFTCGYEKCVTEFFGELIVK